MDRLAASPSFFEKQAVIIPQPVAVKLSPREKTPGEIGAGGFHAADVGDQYSQGNLNDANHQLRSVIPPRRLKPEISPGAAVEKRPNLFPNRKMAV